MTIDLIQLLFLSVSIIGTGLLGTIVFLKKPRTYTTITFSLFALSVAVWSLINFLVDVVNSSALIELTLRAEFSVVVVVAYLFALFADNFPNPRKNILSRGLLIAIPSIIILSLITFSNLILAGYTQFAGGVDVTYGLLGDYYIFDAYLVVYLLFLGIGNLFRKYLKSKGVEKLHLKYIFFGLFGTISISLFTNLVLPTFVNKESDIFTILSRLGVYSTLIFVGLTSYAIVKHRLLDIEVIIRRSLVYSILLASLIAIYSGLIFVLNSFVTLEQTGAFLRVTDVIAIILIAFTVDPLKRVIENTTDKIFFKSRYNAEETINKLSESLVNEIDLTHLVKEIKNVLTDALKVSKLSIYIRSDEEFFPAAIINDFPKDLQTAIEKKHFITKYLDTHHDILILEELDRTIKDGNRLDPHLVEAVKSLGSVGVEIVVPLVVKGDLSGAMFLGEKLSQDIYSSTDIRFIEILSHQAALSLENAKLYEEQKLYGVRLTKEVDRATGDLRHANEKLKELDKLKDEFMSIASHELRTPMTAIKSYVWLALHGKSQEKDKKVRAYLDKVFESSERMISMINDMLNVNRIETGRMKLDIIPVSVWKVAEQVKDELSARAAESKLEIVIKKDNIVPLLMSDKDKLIEIFTNLIGNALKFTPKGGKITVTAKKMGTMVEVQVSDTGVGIAKENIDKLFKKYGKLNESYATVSSSTGTGLGLYITRQYLEKMGGKIGIASTLGKGTTFTFSLPIAAGKDLLLHEREEVQPSGVILNPKLAKDPKFLKAVVKAETSRPTKQKT